MSRPAAGPALVLAALLAACGGSEARRPAQRAATPAAVSLHPTAATGRAAGTKPPVEALLTAETENRLLVVELPSGRVLRTVALAPDPEDLAVDADRGLVVVVSSAAAGKVTMLHGESLRRVGMIGGFDAPHIVAIAPNGAVYVTDDARGTLTVIDHKRVTSTVRVGRGAHHMSFDLLHERLWVALGESARTIVMLDASNLDHPRMIGRFDTSFLVHDLAFSPDGESVWLTSAGGPDVVVFSATDRRLLFHVPVGPPPQHIALDGSYAYLTSGYGSRIEQVDVRTGRILARATAPYGSFELAAGGGYVVTSSLLRGTLAIYTPQLKLLRVVHLAPAIREVAISSRAGNPP